MPHVFPRGVVGALVVFTAGCGTISNLDRPPIPSEPPPCKVFGGVRSDLNDLTRDGGFNPLAVILVMIDIPLSLTGDIITLPWTIPAARERKSIGIP
ncbi:MAG TPA: YceK/YidQ family lipoprotein [Urbifossiella sp.]|jgi:uncharacterized protein YceK|nr:YceK/YidQ family lipoprotein [Urbifossiella sp.]